MSKLFLVAYPFSLDVPQLAPYRPVPFSAAKPVPFSIANSSMRAFAHTSRNWDRRTPRQSEALVLFSL